MSKRLPVSREQLLDPEGFEITRLLDLARAVMRRVLLRRRIDTLSVQAAAKILEPSAPKPTLCVNYWTEQATATVDGRYAYLGPLYRQVKQAAWDALREAATGAAEFSESELVAKFPNEARIQLFGADNYQALRGMHLDGIVLDEYDIHPNAWTEVIRPA